MEDLNQEITRILNHLDKERWIAFSKDESPTTFKAKDKLRAFGLIERHGKLSWQLTKEGYKAVDLGGFNAWVKTQDQDDLLKKVKNFFSKFWWYFIVPIFVGIIVWLLTEYNKDSSMQNKGIHSTIQSNKEQENSTEPTTEKKLSVTNAMDTNKVYLQPFSPVELFNGELIVTLNNTISKENDEIELKFVQKNVLKSETFHKRKIGDIITFNNYIISLLSLERNVSTCDLIIKIETKK